MFKNYFIVACRNLWRNKTLSAINIVGLSIGLACCMLIFLYTKDELSYDRFHRLKNNIYRITAQSVDPQGHEVFRTGKTGVRIGPACKSEVPGVDEYVRVATTSHVLKLNNTTFNQDVLYVDDNFFSVFSFPLLKGDPKKVLTNLNSIVVTDETAKKYFGTTDVIGKTLELQAGDNFQPFIITGIAKKSPQNSTIKFSALLPFKFREKINPDHYWINFFLSTFVVLHPGADEKSVLANITKTIHEKAKEELENAKKEFNDNNTYNWGLQPLLNIHLSTEYDAEDELKDASKPIYSYILSGIAIFILLTACINFINLTIAQSLKRAKEIGIRKVIGGQRNQLMKQFLGESFMICFIAFVLAFVLATLALPFFNEISNKQLSLSYLADTQLIAGFILIFGMTGFAAGFYPALILSGFNPIQTLYNRVKISGRNYLAKILVIIQFALAALLIISTLFIYKQFYFVTHKELGYNDKDLVVIDLPWGNNDKVIDLFKNELAKDPQIKIVGAHNRGRSGTIAKADGKQIQFEYDRIDDKYFDALQIPFAHGRNFSASFPADSISSVIVNESFAREAGWKNPIGKTIDLFWRKRKLTVVGVVKDYHYRPLNEKISPLIFTVEPELDLGQLYIKISPNKTPETLQFIEATYKKLVPLYPVNYKFKNESNEQAYEAGEKWKQIITFAAIFTIFISCLGLFGLATLSAERRIKEIGIRKVLGASVNSIVHLMTNNFLKMVLISNLVAIPIAWWAVNKWLENFAYHINIQWWVFAVGALVTVFIALLTVGFQAIKAAVANPAKSLRTE